MNRLLLKQLKKQLKYLARFLQRQFFNDKVGGKATRDVAPRLARRTGRRRRRRTRNRRRRRKTIAIFEQKPFVFSKQRGLWQKQDKGWPLWHHRMGKELVLPLLYFLYSFLALPNLTNRRRSCCCWRRRHLVAALWEYGQKPPNPHFLLLFFKWITMGNIEQRYLKFFRRLWFGWGKYYDIENAQWKRLW